MSSIAVTNSVLPLNIFCALILPQSIKGDYFDLFSEGLFAASTSKNRLEGS